MKQKSYKINEKGSDGEEISREEQQHTKDGDEYSFESTEVSA